MAQTSQNMFVLRLLHFVVSFFVVPAFVTCKVGEDEDNLDLTFIQP